MNNYISLNIKYLMESNFLTQNDFGKLFGLKRGVVGTYVRGESTPPVDVIQRICKEYGLSIDDFINKDISRLEPVANNKAAEPGQAYKNGAGDGIAGLIAEAVAEKLNPSIQKIDQLTELLAEGEFLLQMKKMRESLLEENKGATHSS